MEDHYIDALKRQLLLVRSILEDPTFRAVHEAALAARCLKPPSTPPAGQANPVKRRKRGRPRKDPINQFALDVVRNEPGLPAHKLPAALGYPSWSEEADERRVERARQAVREVEHVLGTIIEERVGKFARTAEVPLFLASALTDDAGNPTPLDQAQQRVARWLCDLESVRNPRL